MSFVYLWDSRFENFSIYILLNNYTNYLIINSKSRNVHYYQYGKLYSLAVSKRFPNYFSAALVWLEFPWRTPFLLFKPLTLFKISLIVLKETLSTRKAKATKPADIAIDSIWLGRLISLRLSIDLVSCFHNSICNGFVCLINPVPVICS